MDLSQFDAARLDALAHTLFEELAKRNKADIKVLTLLSPSALLNFLYAVSGEFHRRVEQADEADKQKLMTAYMQAANYLFPSFFQAAQQQEQAILLLKRVQEAVGPMLAKPRKTGRNDLIHKYLTELKLGFHEIYKTILEERPELLMKGKGKRAKTVKLETMIKVYKRWVKTNSAKPTPG